MLVYKKLFKIITSDYLNSMGHKNDGQKATQRDREIDRWTYRLDWTPLGTFGPQFGRIL